MSDFKHWEIGDEILKNGRVAYDVPAIYGGPRRDPERLVWFDKEHKVWRRYAMRDFRREVRINYPRIKDREIKEVLWYVLDMAPTKPEGECESV